MKKQDRHPNGAGRSQLSRNFGSRAITYPGRFLKVLQEAAQMPHNLPKDEAFINAMLLSQHAPQAPEGTAISKKTREDREKTFLWLAEMVSATPATDSAFGMDDPEKLGTAKDEMSALFQTPHGPLYCAYMNWLAGQMQNSNSAVYRAYIDLRKKFGSPLKPEGYQPVHGGASPEVRHRGGRPALLGINPGGVGE